MQVMMPLIHTHGSIEPLPCLFATSLLLLVYKNGTSLTAGQAREFAVELQRRVTNSRNPTLDLLPIFVAKPVSSLPFPSNTVMRSQGRRDIWPDRKQYSRRSALTHVRYDTPS
ncbi:hypothetical protein HDV57DRAFT_355636 [Trichoderma longibrachiatum]